MFRRFVCFYCIFVAVRALCARHVTEVIRQVYQKCEGVILPIPWCEEFNFHVEDIFTRLRIVQKEKTHGNATTKEVTNMTSIFAQHEHSKKPRIVLIEGEPGMGKTTYCQKLVYDWASKRCRKWDKSFPRRKVLLYLRCRGIKSSLWDTIEEQILSDEIEAEEKEVFFQFLKKNPAKVLLVLDGLDEADPQTLEMCFKLIHRKQLPGCYIVLTSRHEAGKKVRPYIDTLLEIVGFTTTDAECYIRKYFQQLKEHLAEELISRVRFDMELKELTQNPLNTLLLCVIFEDLKGVLPSNRTQLYVEIVLFILRRYESKNGLSNRGKDLLLVYKQELMILGEIALDSLHRQEMYFDDHKGDIKESLLMKFGFLSIQSGGSKRAPCDRYGFFHKSFQEFFSSYFLAYSVIDDVTKSHLVLTDPRYRRELYQVFKFMIGIIVQQSEQTTLSVVQSIASFLNERGLTSDEHGSYFEVAHYFMMECKACSGDLHTKLACTFGESLKLVDVVVRMFEKSDEYIGTFFQALTFNFTVTSLTFIYHWTSNECIDMLAHALTVNTSLSSLDLRLKEANSFSDTPTTRRPLFGNEGANSLVQALKVNTSLSSLDLSNNLIRGEGANSLAQVLRVNTSLSSFNLSSNSIRDKEAISLAQALTVNTSLSSLDLSCNFIGDEGANSLAQALTVNTSLSSLDLSCNSIGDEGANSLVQALRVNTSLSSLNLCHNSSVHDEANLLAQALSVNTSLSSFDLSRNVSSSRKLPFFLSLSTSRVFSLSDSYDKEAITLAQALGVNTSLSSLDLSHNAIHGKGANSLAQALRVNTSLSFLGLRHNAIHGEGANSLAQALKVNTSLSSLDLCWNSIKNKGANSLAQALRVNTSLSSLNLGGNFIGAEGANSLAEALRVNTSLSSLNLFQNYIGARGAESLAQTLRVNTSLSSLDLSHNEIHGKGANSLAQALKVNTSLSSLDLCWNLILDNGANSLAQALSVNTSLSSLHLGGNFISPEGANSLAQALRVNTSLSSLDLGRNSIGDEGANSLTQALSVRNSLSSFQLHLR